jgi:hypothetical protein
MPELIILINGIKARRLDDRKFACKTFHEAKLRDGYVKWRTEEGLGLHARFYFQHWPHP